VEVKPVAIVTGASRGIGRQVALRLARRGFRLTVAARTATARAGTPGTLLEAADELRTAGTEVVEVIADMAADDDLQRIVDTTLQTFGRIDALVNNAAYTVGRTLFTHVPDLSRDQWDKHFAVNVTAPLMLIQRCWPSMIEQGGGVVVNMTSGAAALRVITRSEDLGLLENGPAYGASKAALDRMANVIAAEGATHRIAVVNVDPGFVLTETMAATLGPEAVATTTAIPMTVPAAIVEHLCTCPEPMTFSGTIVHAPTEYGRLGLR
jgi:NAD(P)-dependent dehydrogenase (short-subunit alcohol dehydrogenase family)